MSMPRCQIPILIAAGFSSRLPRYTYGADDPNRLVADIAQPALGLAALPPDIARPPLLPDPRLVLAPDFKPLGPGMCVRDFG